MRNSTVWYSQILTGKLGIEKLQHYVNQFQYGNQNLHGDFEKDSGLTHSWLSSSLKISPLEQLRFLDEFLISENKIISSDARQQTKNIMCRKDLDFNNWKVFGKTGSGFHLTSSFKKDTHMPFGWFVGFIENKDKMIIFVNHVTQYNKSNEEIYLGQKALTLTMKKLSRLFGQ